LLPWIEAHYRLRRDRRGRSLPGISMGGHGAFAFAYAYAAKYPQYFGSAAALSPALDSNPLLGRTVLDDGAAPDGGVEGAIWGPRASEELRWRGHKPIDPAESLRRVDLFIRSGSGNGRRSGELLFLDIFEAVVHEMSVNMSEALQAQGIAHHFDDYGFGTHAPDFWREGLRLLLPEMFGLMQQPALPVRVFSCRSIDPLFEVRGWQVSFASDALEFARLGDASKAGFSLSGSGVARVVTARWFRPDQLCPVQIDGQREVLTSSAEGRLDIGVDLGPGRQVQEYRPGNPRGFLRTVTVRLAPVEK